jgi:3D (Asp-Asp-Asp) domain-containing protein
MQPLLSQSIVLKIVALVVAVLGFVLVYETRMLDSGYAAWQAMLASDGSLTPAPGAHLPFSATAYCKGTTTASGVIVRTGIAASDPTLLPVGTVVNLATGEPKYNGVYTVMDTGPKVQGRHLDLYMWSCKEALSFGRKNVQVTVLRLGWDPRASSPGLIDRLFRGRLARRAVPEPEPPPPASLGPVGEDMPDPNEIAVPAEAGAALQAVPPDGVVTSGPASAAPPVPVAPN